MTQLIVKPFINLRANSAEDKLITIFLIFPSKCTLTFSKETICIKCQNLFSEFSLLQISCFIEIPVVNANCGP